MQPILDSRNSEIACNFVVLDSIIRHFDDDKSRQNRSQPDK